jgi:hypothetical protein
VCLNLAEKFLTYYQSTVKLEATITVLPQFDTFKNLTNFILNCTQYHYHLRLMELLVKGCSYWFSWAAWPWTELVQRLSKLTPWSRHLLQKVTVRQSVKFPSLYKTWRFITTLITAHHWSQSWVRQIQFTAASAEKLNVILHKQGKYAKWNVYLLFNIYFVYFIFFISKMEYHKCQHNIINKTNTFTYMINHLEPLIMKTNKLTNH